MQSAPEALTPEPAAMSPEQQGWFFTVAVFLMWMFMLGSVFAGLGLLAVVEPPLAALLYRPTEGTVRVVGSTTAMDNEPPMADYPEVRYEAGGATHTSTSWVPVSSSLFQRRVATGDRLRVYYPSARPAEGLVCDWSEDRAGNLLRGLGIGLAVAGLTTGLFRLSTGRPAGGPRRFARWAAKSLAVWLACILLAGAGGLVLLGSSRNLLAMLAGPVAGGALGAFLALREAWRARAPASLPA